NVLWSRSVTSQPEDTIDPAQVEAFGNVVVFSELPGRNNYRARRRPMLRRRKPFAALWLVKKLKSEMWTKFERTQRQAKFGCSPMDLCHGGPLCKTKIVDRNLHFLKERHVL